MVATETVRTVFLVLLGLAILWVIACIVRNDMATIVRALIVTGPSGGSPFSISTRPSSRR